MSEFKVGDRVVGNQNMNLSYNVGRRAKVIGIPHKGDLTVQWEDDHYHSDKLDSRKFDLYVDPAEPKASYKDTSKAPLEELLAVPDALEAIARLFRWAHDTKGYGFKQFETLDPGELRDALMRHTFQTGIKHLELDDQSKMLHAIHAAANGLMYVQNLINRSKPAN